LDVERRQNDRLIRFKLIQQMCIRLDKGGLLLGGELERDRLRLAMVHTQPVQSRDQ
jgi:hypothetical protein